MGRHQRNPISLIGNIQNLNETVFWEHSREDVFMNSETIVLYVLMFYM